MSYEVISQFLEEPGCWERHLQRKYKNPLFADGNSITLTDVRQAQERDQALLKAFDEQFQTVLQKAIELPTHAQSDVVLGLKEQIDKLYEESAALSGKQLDKQHALLKLLEVVMRVIRLGAQNDAYALQQLQQEEVARQLHIELLRFPVVADLLRADSPILEYELAAVLLIETPAAIQAVLSLLAPAEQQLLRGQCEAVVEKMKDRGVDVPFVEDRLAEIREAIQ